MIHVSLLITQGSLKIIHRLRCWQVQERELKSLEKNSKQLQCFKISLPTRSAGISKEVIIPGPHLGQGQGQRLVAEPVLGLAGLS